MRLLFICSRNQWRSPTAERVFRGRPDLEVRSAGVSDKARRRVSERDLAWADLVLVMEKKHKRMLDQRFGRDVAREIEVLDIPDDYKAMDPELVELLEERVAEVLARLPIL